MHQRDCVFCRIVRGEAPADIVYEDGDTIAFLDIRPLSPGHTLVVPKHHYGTIVEVPDAELGAFFVAVKRVAAAIARALGADGIRIAQNNGRAAGQIVPHLHVHVIPRYLRAPTLPRDPATIAGLIRREV